jgi:predicted restriction endonuclease
MSGSDGDGMGEDAQRGFAADYTYDAHTDLQAIVLMTYRYRCALTGAQFERPTLHLHPDLDVVAIQPREQGGPLAIANYLPMLYSLNAPFRDGLITIDDDYRIIVPHPDLLDREVQSALRASVVLPDAPPFYPGQAFLAHHRRYALGR